MSKATPLRELSPGSAWNEAMRRATVISIAGFFIPNLLANFGVIPQLHQSFQFVPGICGVAGGVFSVHGAFSRLLPWSGGSRCRRCHCRSDLALFSTWLWFRVTHPSTSAGLLQLFAPTVILAIGFYLALMQWHARVSNFTVDGLTEQMVGDEYGKPRARWEQVTCRICQVIGGVVILLLILAAFGRGR